jgi:transcriptional regulator with XRE-family HTH domain
MDGMPAVAKQDPVDAEIGERLHTWMWRNRVPQTGFADVLGISQQSLGRKLRGESAWSAGELRRAGVVLRVSIGWFFGETEEEPVRPKGLEPLTFWMGVWRYLRVALPGRRRPGGLVRRLTSVRGGAVRTSDLELAA